MSKGVKLHKGRWHARIGYAKRLIHIGYFDTEAEASQAYAAKAAELYGEFARLSR